jgi:hypothetical protein
MKCFTINGDTKHVTREIYVQMKPYPHIAVGKGKYQKWVDVGNKDYHLIKTKERYTTEGIKLSTSYVIQQAGVLYLKDYKKHIIVEPRVDEDKTLVLLNVPSGLSIDCNGKLIVKHHSEVGCRALMIFSPDEDVLVDRAENQPSLLLTYLGNGRFNFDNSKMAHEYDDEMDQAV